MGIEIVENTTENLERLAKGLKHNARVMLDVANIGVAMIETRTALARSDAGGTFPPYLSRGTYYAPTDKRPAGYPMPAGGRTTHKRTGQALKTVAYDGGYASYKAGIGRGALPQLSVSGEMLGDMATRGGNGWAEIYFATELSKAKAHGHHVSGRYHFFGLDYVTIQTMIADMARHIDTLKKRLAM